MNQIQPPHNTNIAGNTGTVNHAQFQSRNQAQNHSQLPDEDRVDFLTGQRDLKAFNKANSHSSRVRILRILLPIIAVLMIVGIAGSYFWKSSSAPTLSVQSTSFDNGNMVMKNPVLRGVDKENRPYELKAKEAIQDVKELTIIELHEIDAVIPMEGTNFANIKAGNGLYDSKAKTLVLGGEVDILSDDGIRVKLQDADIDIDAGNMFTNNPVFMSSPQAEIYAGSIAIEENGESITFNKNVKMTLYPKNIKSAQNISIDPTLAGSQPAN